MKKKLSVILSGLVMLSLGACQSNETEDINKWGTYIYENNK